MGILKRLFGAKESTQQTHPTHNETFDANNPSEILKIVSAMCLIAANAGDSNIYVALQDEDISRGFSKSISLLASIDNCSGSCTHDASSYMKFGVSRTTASYLATVPFKTKEGTYSNDFKVEFCALPDYPSHLTNQIINEMRKGVSQSKFINAGVRHASINANMGVLTCSID